MYKSFDSVVCCAAVMSGSVGNNVKNKLNEFESVGAGGGPGEASASTSAASTDAAIDSLLQLIDSLRSTVDSIAQFRNRSNSLLQSELNADDVGMP